MSASINGNLEMGQYLVSKGADITILSEGASALDHAKNYQHSEIIEYLESLK